MQGSLRFILIDHVLYLTPSWSRAAEQGMVQLQLCSAQGSYSVPAHQKLATTQCATNSTLKTQSK